MTRHLRAVVVDDVALARQKLVRLLSAHADVSVVGEAAEGPAAVAVVRELEPDVVFLDVQMPEMDGFSVALDLKSGHAARIPAFVFVTAYDHYAARAFGIEAIDYLLKPPTPERLGQCLRRVREFLAGPRDESHPRYSARIAVRERDRCRWVPVTDIAWIEAAGNYLVLHTDEGRHVIRATLAAVERQLDPMRFCRIGRSRVAAIDRIQALEPQNSGDQVAILDGDVRLPVSRRCRAHLIERLAGRAGKG